ncbi:hypothetical protein TanjilG_12346 [Lupinus angustifolius]|uniref:Uncharacterized protein n=1 Tax=Lupinus angustifolius TaxID=3871 RepID=A0A4P1QYK4_LUPAN|nr:PREDICTED: uncharacterized protein LOC109326220 [Lupinus angustifolius]OIV97589.1 hypothetical protein TanjilG_12346 [Lupinus angustifolius]
MLKCATLTPLENEVVEILTEFCTLGLSNLESGFQFPFTWGRKRLRSAISDSSSSLSPSPPPPLKAEASSPATPFSFSPSESEDKRTLLRKNVSLKRKKDHYLKTIEGLTKDNGLLHGEVKNVKYHLNMLRDFNLKLKARKEELCLESKPQELEITSMVHSPPLILNQTNDTEVVPNVQFKIQQETMLLGNRNDNVGPNGIPDLNLLPVEEPIMEEEFCEVSVADKNLSRVIAASQARLKRIQICKMKNPIANNKLRYSWR